MSAWDSFKGFFVKAPGAPRDIATAVAEGHRSQRKANGALIEAYGTSPWLYAVASTIAQSVAAIEWILEVPERKSSADGSKSETYLHKQARRGSQRAISRLRQKSELREIDEHPVLELIAGGNKHLSGEACIEVTQLFMDLMGEAFWVLDLGAGGKPTSYWPMPPTWVQDTPKLGADNFKLRIKAGIFALPSEQVVWIKNPNPADPYARGIGVASAISDELDTDEYAEHFVKTFFFNDAGVSSVVSLKGANDKAVKEIESKWNAKFRGAGNAHRTAFTGAEIDVKILAQSFKDMNIVALRKAIRDNIIQVPGIPPEILGIVENSNRATIDGAEVIFAKRVLLPRLNRLRSAIQSLAQRFDEKLIVGFVSPVPADRSHELNVMKATPGNFTVNEWRRAAGHEARPDGDELYSAPVAPAFGPPGGDGDNGGEPGASAPKPKPEKPDATDDEDEPADKAVRRKALSPGDINAIMEALAPAALSKEIDPVFKRRVQEWGAAMLDELGISAAFDMLNPLVVDHLEELSGDRITGINETTREQIGRALGEGVEAGEDIDDLSARVRTVFSEASVGRSRNIARSEVIRSSNFAQWDAQVQSGLDLMRQWVATRDDRTRVEHTDLDGDLRDLYEPFTIDGNEANYPGDFGVAELDINCRCTTVPVVKGEQPKSLELLDLAWKRFDESVRPWEAETVRAIQRAFDKQETAALKELRKRAA